MGYHVYKTNWTSVVGEKLTGVMESNNLMVVHIPLYAVAVKKSDESIVWTSSIWENLETLQRQYSIL